MFDVFRSSSRAVRTIKIVFAVDGGPLDGGLPDSRFVWVRRQRKPGPDRGRDRQERPDHPGRPPTSPDAHAEPASPQGNGGDVRRADAQRAH